MTPCELWLELSNVVLGIKQICRWVTHVCNHWSGFPKSLCPHTSSVSLHFNYRENGIPTKQDDNFIHLKLLQLRSSTLQPPFSRIHLITKLMRNISAAGRALTLHPRSSPPPVAGRTTALQAGHAGQQNI